MAARPRFDAAALEAVARAVSAAEERTAGEIVTFVVEECDSYPEATWRGGLYGALSIRKPSDPKPDREFVVFLETTLDFKTINGRAFVGNTPVFHSRVGELVQWDVLSIGDDFHTFHVHGHRWLQPDGTPRDTQVVGPAESFKFRWREDTPGTWLYHCHVESHMMNGMIGIYRVGRR